MTDRFTGVAARFKLTLLAVAVGAFLVSTSSTAQDVPPEVLQALEKIAPGAQPDAIGPSPVAGLYEVVLGPQVVYFSADGETVLQGDFISIDTGENLTESTRAAARLASLERLGEDSMIVFSPETTKHTVTVFTDVDCGVCARLHRDMPQLNKMGIKVRYVAFPRAGIDSETYDVMQSVWCSDDSRQAMTDAKRGLDVEPRECENPIQVHYTTGRLFGVNATPTLILDNGSLVRGYRSAPTLMQHLRQLDAS